MHKSIRLATLAATLLLAACATGPQTKNYAAFNAAKPRSILIVPVINHTSETEAGDLFLTTLAAPLAERGYYVFPTSAAKKLIETDGMADPQLVHSAATPRIASLFGADAVLYVEILEWNSVYSVLASSIDVGFLYTLKDGHTDALLWQDQQRIVYKSSGGSGNIIADLVSAAVTAAINNTRSDYTPVAQFANNAALLVDGQGVPYGPYSPSFAKNNAAFPTNGSGSLTNAKLAAIAYPLKDLPASSSKVEAPAIVPVKQ